MSSAREIHDILTGMNFELAGPVASNPGNDESYVAFVKIKTDTKGQKKPGARALSQAMKHLYEDGYNVSLVAVGDEGSDFDATLKAIIFKNFGERINNAFSSFANQRADVWIEPKNKISSNERENIRSVISDFCNLIGFDLTEVSFTDAENTPAATTILKVLRLKAPCNAHVLETLLEQRGFTVPNVVWLNHTLDKMRKSGLIVRGKSGEFFLSLNGLSRLGTIKARQSPDILRALDFAKRGA